MFSKRMLVIGSADIMILLLSVLMGMLSATSGEAGFSQATLNHSSEWTMFLLVLIGCLISMGLYNPDYMFDMQEAVMRLITGFLITFVAVSLLLGFVKTAPVLRQALPPALALSFAGLLAVRYAASSTILAQYLKRRVLVLGAGVRARRIEEEIRKKHGHCGFIPVAYVPASPDERGVSVVHIIDNPQDLNGFCEYARVDEIVLAADERRGTMPIDVLLECRMSGRKITTVTDFIEREAGQVELEGLYPSWLVFSVPTTRNIVERGIKRLFDIVISLAFLLLTFPLLLVTAICILLDDGAPVFYRQTRTGLRGKPFDVLKFRSMKKDAEKDGVARWAAQDDDRITRVGRFIRKTRIDELPQIFNVLAGSMSFVGPRPERPSIVADLESQIPFFRYRHVVKPGITGWAQVNYPYGASVEDAREKLKYDLYYIKNESLVLDLLILMETVRVVFWPSGAR
ncbi:MAG TPA: sugar transferase [Alphaproteobacteria bacterium]|jgi:sugar transferase (PEP-CTERM system associated)|nr:sugar transferase [Alphaproteobacteria bacterium]